MQRAAPNPIVGVRARAVPRLAVKGPFVFLAGPVHRVQKPTHLVPEEQQPVGIGAAPAPVSMAQGLLLFWHMIDPKVITEILKANGTTSRPAPGSPLGNPTGLPFRDPKEIPAGSAGEALFG